VQIDDTRVVPLTLLAQAGAGLVTAAGVWLVFGRVAGASALLGAAAAVIPNGFLAARLLSRSAGASAKALLRAAWLGEAGKLLLTALALGTIFALVRPLAPPAVLGGFIAAQLVVFMGLLLNGDRARLTESTTKS
jgi:F0F1-type ATP synthase assembly protein I